jgi:Icc-related predicted phosphoesterase
MDKLCLIGDVHGEWDKYIKITERLDCQSVCVGDLGFDIYPNQEELDKIDTFNHKAFPGNHDGPSFFNHKISLGRYGYLKPYDAFYIGGAETPKHARSRHKWFSDEELTNEQFIKIIDLIKFIKPKVILTHDAPDSVRRSFFDIKIKTKTSFALQAIFDAHQPEQWIFGHHHRSKHGKIKTTNFRCLNKLETYILNYE